MDEDLDNDLKDHIREVFDNFEDPTADEGWLQLRQKFPEERTNRRAFAWIWWSAAAILFLFLSIGIWMYSKNDHLEKSAVKPRKHTQSENLTATKNTPVTGSKNMLGNTKNQPRNSGDIVNNSVATHSNPLKIPTRLKNNTPANVPANLSLNDTAGKKTYIVKTADSIKKAENKSPAQQLAATDQAINSTSESVVAKPKPQAKSINDMFAEDQATKTKKSIDNTNRVRFGVYAATYFNYAKGSGNNANIGAGVTSEIKISKNLKLETGITIGQNFLNFTTGVPTSTAQSNLASFTVPGVQGPAGPSSSASTPSNLSAYTINSAVTLASVPAFRNYDASLVGLEIPLNLKYEFNPARNDIYVLAGLSSGTFINEIYTYQYNYPDLFSPSLQKIQNETSRGSFNSFYFAKTLNLAFGIGHHLGKNRIILEPFLKYPLDGLGSQNIRFGAGGLNLKFNFQSPQK